MIGGNLVLFYGCWGKIGEINYVFGSVNMWDVGFKSYGIDF